jgi:hypothetical protein
MCNVANNIKHSTIIGWVVIVVERELERLLSPRKYIKNNSK